MLNFTFFAMISASCIEIQTILTATEKQQILADRQTNIDNIMQAKISTYFNDKTLVVYNRDVPSSY